MAASIQSARLLDGGDPGLLRAVALVCTAYVPGESVPTAGDTTPPVVSNVSPASGSTVAASATLSERVTDAQALKGVVILALFSDRTEGVYDGRLVDDAWEGGFFPGYTSSTITPTTGGFDFGLVRSAGWYGAFSIRTRAHDGNGNE